MQIKLDSLGLFFFCAYTALLSPFKIILEKNQVLFIRNLISLEIQMGSNLTLV